MEELKCPSCGEPIKRDMTECPKCGYKFKWIQEEKKEETGKAEAKADASPVHIAAEKLSEAVKEKKEEISKKKSDGRKWRINILACISLIIGLSIINMGVKLKNTDVSMTRGNFSHMSVPYAAFGGDFFTEIYQASDTMVDELNQVNQNTYINAMNLEDIGKIIYTASGTIVIAIGLGISAVSISKIVRLKN